MPLKRSFDQSMQTLEEFYTEMLKEDESMSTIVIGNAMLAFIEMVNQTFKETILWGVTFHYRLVLQAEDNWLSDWLIVVNSIGTSEYYFEYRLPPDKSPWEHATVKGIAQSLNEAKKYLIISMRESEGWPTSNELKLLELTMKE